MDVYFHALPIRFSNTTPSRRASATIEKLNLPEEQQFGVAIIKRAVEEPLRQIAANGGFEGSIIVNKVKESKGNHGWNAATAEFEDLVEAGVIDPAKVCRIALQNAASVASLMLTTEAMIAELPKKEEAAAGGGHGGHGHGGGMM